MERLTEKTENGYVLKIPKDKNISDLEIKFNVYDKLGAYEDAEEQGLLLRLPCKVGDTVYVFRRIDDILTVGKHTFKTLTNLVAMMENGDFGREVFLTREEAEKALADMGV